VPDKIIGLVNVVFVYRYKYSVMGEAGVGGEGNARGARAVDFKPGTWKRGNLHHEKGIAFPSKLIHFSKIHTRLILCVCSELKRVLCAA
jgi:hypothetical protein